MSKNAVTLINAPTAAFTAFVEEWKTLDAWLAGAKAREAELRKYIVATILPSDAKEGVNTVQSSDGLEFKVTVKVNRSLDEAALDSVMQALPEDSPWRKQGVLIEFKPRLVLGGFRTLPENQMRIFSKALTETPGMPELEIRPAPGTEALPIAFIGANGTPAAPKKRGRKPGSKNKK